MAYGEGRSLKMYPISALLLDIQSHVIE